MLRSRLTDARSGDYTMQPLAIRVAALGLAAALAGPTAAEAETLWERIEAEPSLATFADLAAAAGLDETLSTEGLYTVFAPSDAAFAAMPAETREAVLEAPTSEAAKAFLARHIAQGRLEAQYEMGRVAAAQMLSGETQRFAARFAGCGALEASLGEAELLFTDLHATNGVLHVLGEPL